MITVQAKIRRDVPTGQGRNQQFDYLDGIIRQLDFPLVGDARARKSRRRALWACFLFMDFPTDIPDSQMGSIP